MLLSAAWIVSLSMALAMPDENPPPVAGPGIVMCFVFDDTGLPLRGAEVRVGAERGVTDEVGAVELPVASGVWPLFLVIGDEERSLGDVSVFSGRVTEAILHLQPNGSATVEVEAPPLAPPPPLLNAEEVEASESKVPGHIHGRVVSFEGGAVLEGVRVLVRSESTEVVTDEQGRFVLTLPAGEYALSFVHPDYSAEIQEGLLVTSHAVLEVNVELTPAAVELESFRVTVPHIAGSLAASVDEKRTAGSITEVLGAEQMSQGGDGDAAGALRRVTGVTVVGGRYVYVRGLGERYSSTLLNGAALPSPEPERRVVPLDLFPTGILDGMVIHKTYSPRLPGEFG
ncbi:MAG: carboxypeptidase regulatory-like domain-containing protein, partial [Myxococcota bacterium]